MCLCVHEKISKDAGVSLIKMYFKENSVGAKLFWCADGATNMLPNQFPPDSLLCHGRPSTT